MLALQRFVEIDQLRRNQATVHREVRLQGEEGEKVAGHFHVEIELRLRFHVVRLHDFFEDLGRWFLVRLIQLDASEKLAEPFHGVGLVGPLEQLHPSVEGGGQFLPESRLVEIFLFDLRHPRECHEKRDHSRQDTVFLHDVPPPTRER